MNWLQAIVYGIIQGLTEFIPVSSSGHLNIAPALFRWQDPGAGFTAVIQLGTLVATFVYFWDDLRRAFTAWARSIGDKNLRQTTDARIGWATFWGTLPLVVLGYVFKKFIATDARDLRMTAGLLIGFGLLLLVAELVGKKTRRLEDATVRDGVILGLWQACALIPGASRSGSSITGGLFAGLDRSAAARLSFLMSVPAVLGSGLYELWDARHELMSFGAPQTIAATAVSFFVGMAAIHFLITFLKNHRVTPFVIYRVVFGVLVLTLVSNGTIPAKAGPVKPGPSASAPVDTPPATPAAD